MKTRAACGDEIEVEGDALTIRAQLPIPELEPSAYRKPVLSYEGARFTLLAKEGLTYRLTREQQNLYAPGGDVIFYDGERHLERARERKAIALGWLLWLPTIPLMPLIGLLPESAKQRLVVLGVDPGRATRLSLTIEWALFFAGAVIYFALGAFWTLPGVVVGAIVLFIGLDIAYRVTADAGGQSPGAFAVAGEIRRMVIALVGTVRGTDRLLDDNGEPLDADRRK